VEAVHRAGVASAPQSWRHLFAAWGGSPEDATMRRAAAAGSAVAQEVRAAEVRAAAVLLASKHPDPVAERMAQEPAGTSHRSPR
jgi:hypothetical protein